MKGAPKNSIYIILLVIFFLGAYFSKAPTIQSENGPIEVASADEPTPKVLPVAISSTVSARKAPIKIKGVIVTEKGDDLLVLVNKNIRLRETYEPNDLVKLDGKVPTTYFGIFLRKEAFDGLLKMVNAAKKAGYNLVVTSGYRSYWQQDATFAHWVKVYGLTKASDLSARPGHSQHQLGTAVDFQLWQGSREYGWLLKNSYKYGFVISYPWGKDKITGYAYEPWHYRYIGVENARKMREEGLILEQFLQENGVW